MGDLREASKKIRDNIRKGLNQVKKADVAAIVSGGLDSVTMVYELLHLGYVPHLLSFDYGQRHRKELHFAAACAQRLGLRHDVINLSSISELISNSALTSQNSEHGDIEVPDGHYAEETMKQTVVPNRNMIMLSIAAGVMVNNGYKYVATGVHSGDHFIYPDCRPRFINAAGAAIALGNAGFGAMPEVEEGMMPMSPILAPFIHSTKADIAFRALELGVPFHQTWSCYKGGEKHCGRCGTCVERLEAINEASQRFCQVMGHTTEADGISPNVRRMDMTEYEDIEFWRTQVEK